MNLGRLAGQDIVVPGVGGCFEQFRESVLGIPEGLVEQGGQGAIGTFADAAHVTVTRLPHDFENGGMAAKAVGVTAGRGQADHLAAEGIFDQFFGVGQLVSERGLVVAQGDQVWMGEGMALDVEERMVEDGAQLLAGEFEHFGDEEKGGGRVALQMHFGDRGHALEKLGDVRRRVAETILAPIPPGVYGLSVIGGYIVGHFVPPIGWVAIEEGLISQKVAWQSEVAQCRMSTQKRVAHFFCAN